jgi:hypothetical protein
VNRTFAGSLVNVQKKILYSQGYKYWLREDHYHVLPPCFKGIEVTSDYLVIRDCILLIRKGYAWNGCSGPTFDTKTNMRAGLVHDAGYQLIVEGLIERSFKDEMDGQLKEICLEDGMNSIRASYFFKGVEVFGKASTIRNTQIYVAP